MRRLAVGALAVLTLLLPVVFAADAEAHRKRRPRAVAAAVATPGPAGFVQPPRSLHPCGGRTNATPSAEVQAAIHAAAAESNVDAQLLFAIARGESAYNPNAANRRSSARGLFQHLTSRGYWSGRVTAFNGAHPAAPLASPSVFDPVTASRVTAWMLAGGMGRNSTRAWQC